MTPGKVREFLVSRDQAGTRLDRFLHNLYPAVSINRWRRALAREGVRVDGRPAKKGVILQAGQKVAVAAALPAALHPASPQPETGPLQIIYQDAELLAVNKPAGCHTHPLRPGETGTLANFLVAAFPELVEVGGFGPLQPGLVNRLDQATSGVVVVARSQPAWERLRGEFAAHRVVKEYLGLVEGFLKAPLQLAEPLTHDPADRRRMTVASRVPGARHVLAATTRISPAAYDPGRDLSLVRLTMRTGVMHQLRVHLALAGHPLAGDHLYGATSPSPVAAAGFCLHCLSVTLPAAAAGSGLTLTAPPPAWAEAF